MGATFKDLGGQKFGRLLILSFGGFKKRRHGNVATWEALCDCGKKVVIFSGDLLSQDTKSCGCLQKEVVTKMMLKHGFHGKSSSVTQQRFYKIWQDMKSRCLNSNNRWYSNYGGRGITVCERWLESFENFRDDMYQSYLDHVKKYGEDNTSIDRILVNGNYSLLNCRWATQKDQNINKRYSIVSKNLKEHKKWKTYLDIVMRRAALGIVNNSKYIKYFGCTSSELHNYLQSKFIKNMTWKNYGRYNKKVRIWQIDHIIPANMFDLSLEKDRYLCYNYKNLRPMWADEHMKKSRNRENYELQ